MHRTRLIAAAAWLTLVGCGVPAAPTPLQTADATAVGTVTLRIIGDDATRTYRVDAVAAGTTVADVMRRVPGVDWDIVGRGEMTFLNGIDGRSTSSDSGWTYQVDGEFADEGIGTFRLDPPATVTWKFGGWDDVTAAD